MIESPFPSPASLLPHGEIIRFAQRIVACDPNHLECTARIPSSSPFVRDHRVPSFILIEVAAQAAGLLWVLQGAGSHSPKSAAAGSELQGYLVSVRAARFSTATLSADRDLRVLVDLDGAAPPLWTYRFRIELDGDCSGEGSLSLYVDPGS